MKKYYIDIKLKDDPMNYSIVGYPNQKKCELLEHLDWFAEEKNLEYHNKNNLFTNNEGQIIGYYEFGFYEI